MNAKKYFTENLNMLPKGLGGAPLDQEKHNLYAGLLELAKQLDQIQKDQRTQHNDLGHLQSIVRGLR